MTATGFGTYSQSSALTCGETFTDIDLCALAAECMPCAIPKEDLTISWTNILTGPGSDTLVFTGPSSWKTASCSGNGDNLIFELRCTSDTLELRATYFTSGACPTGTSEYCSNLEGTPKCLILSATECDPFDVTWTCSGVGGCQCATLSGLGYTSLTITS